MLDLIESALRDFEMMNVHTFQAMIALGLATRDIVQPPALVLRPFTFPPTGPNQTTYEALLTKDNADFVDGLIATNPHDANAVGLGVLQRIGEIQGFYKTDVFPDLNAVLNNSAMPTQRAQQQAGQRQAALQPAQRVRAGFGTGGGGDPATGCCTVGNTKVPDLTLAQCRGAGGSWDPTNPSCGFGRPPAGRGQDQVQEPQRDK
jgi:hypothetical protein